VRTSGHQADGPLTALGAFRRQVAPRRILRREGGGSGLPVVRGEDRPPDGRRSRHCNHDGSGRGFVHFGNQLASLVTKASPEGLLAKQGVGIDVAGALLVTAGDNAERLGSEAGFAAVSGASPVDASSGRQVHHRLNRGGERQANAALWRIVMTRLACDPRTANYVELRSTPPRPRRKRRSSAA